VNTQTQADPPKIEKNEDMPIQATPSVPTVTNDAGKKVSNEDAIQKALNATVSVRTPWGSIGSGFFIGEHDVITNKHVVKNDTSNDDSLAGKVERNRKIIDLENEKIIDWKKKVQQMPAGPTRTQWELFIQGREEDLSKAQSVQRENEEKLAKLKEQMKTTEIKIITSDNKEYLVDRIITSDTHDLALLKVSSVSGQALKPKASGRNIEQGQEVYTIGSPMGLSNTVTSGIFSAYRKHGENNETYLQFDAAINPGNSGGPLIDKEGNVLGVNTMMLSQAAGIGFAIPIEVVFEDFSGSF